MKKTHCWKQSKTHKLGFIVHPVGRGILDAPGNLHGKLTLPTAII